MISAALFRCPMQFNKESFLQSKSGRCCQLIRPGPIHIDAAEQRVSHAAASVATVACKYKIHESISTQSDNTVNY